MIHIERESEPAFWEKYRKKHPSVHYNDLDKSKEGKQVRQQIRIFNINQQHGLCAYCCKSIHSENSLNEHIKPKGVGRYSSCSMDYENIIASCKTDGQNPTCSASKGNKYDEGLFISPLDTDCESYFDYFPNGEVFSSSPKGQYTISLLNLNSRKLCQARKRQLEVCEQFGDANIVKELFLQPDDHGNLSPYADITKYWVNHMAKKS